MPDIIHLLPDSVANQIAAGEVVQRPASVVKELVENAVDAGGTSIKIILKDAGKTLIQVIDNGSGMSETDARLAFERHATSKIIKADDLFAIQTMGFRGEALASIAAIAEVTLKTRREEDEIGLSITINGSELTDQQPVSCPAGSNFSVRSLFFNVPARRKFLKSNTTELKNIIQEFQRMVLANPDTEFSLSHNDSEIYHLPATNIRQRIVHTFRKSINQNLIDLSVNTSIVKIKGYIGKPEFAKKTAGEQFFFVNKRYMRHPYFHHAVMQAYEKVLPPDSLPSYFIYLEVDPSSIDVNIHPTKTEIKFEDERSIYQILIATVREAMGRFNVTPSLDFNRENAIEIPALGRETSFKQPGIEVNPDFNPFQEEKKRMPGSVSSNLNKSNQLNWEKLYAGFEKESVPDIKPEDTTPADNSSSQATMNLENAGQTLNFIQIKNKYILTPVKSGLMVIDQKRAHERILFEKYLKTLEDHAGIAQQNLYPQTIDLDPADYMLLLEISDDLVRLGFDIRNFGINTVVIHGLPADLQKTNAVEVIETLLEEYKNSQTEPGKSARERVARSLSKASAIKYGMSLTREEMREIMDKLFACSNPNYSADGKPVLTILQLEDIEKNFK